MSKIKTPTLSSSKKICMILTTVFVFCFTILISLRIGSIDISFYELCPIFVIINSYLLTRRGHQSVTKFTFDTLIINIQSY